MPESGWNTAALKNAFLNSLNEDLKNELNRRNKPSFFDTLTSLSIHIESRLTERNGFQQTHYSAFLQDFHISPEPTKHSSSLLQKNAETIPFGNNILSPEERQNGMDTNCNLYCPVILFPPFRTAQKPEPAVQFGLQGNI